MTVGRDVAFPLLTTPTAQCAAQVDFASHVRLGTLGLRGKVALLTKVRQLVRHVLLTATAWTETVGRDVAFPPLTTPTAQCATQVEFASHVRLGTLGLRGKVALLTKARQLVRHVLLTPTA